MKSICGSDCCDKCAIKDNACEGCSESLGHPCGGNCIAAKCINAGGFEKFGTFKKELVDQINSLGIEGLSVSDLNLMNGAYVNLEYDFPNGSSVKFLNDKDVYFANQIKISGSDKFYGVCADDKMLVVSRYGANGRDPELILYKKR